MKFIKQLFLILFISFLGELLSRAIPFPMPASVYGIILMLICLKTGLIHLHQIENVADFFLEIMPVLFVPAAVGLLTVQEILVANLLTVSAIILITTVIVMAVSGWVAQFFLTRKKKEASDDIK